MQEILAKPKNSIIFCYLCGVKEDYAYNIAKNFRTAIKQNMWKKDNLKVNSYLTIYSNIHKVLKNFEKNKLISPSKEKKVKRKIQKYYKINPNVFINEKIFENTELKTFIDKHCKPLPEYKAKSDREILEEAFNLSFFEYALPSLDIITELNKWKRFDFFTILYMNHIFITKYITDYSPQTHDKYSKAGNIDLRELSLLLLEKYFNIYKDSYFMALYREDL
ncbi:MAG: hypothetical protein ACTSO9_01420 [Candidatus Helarchaeota archaeon]